MTRIPVNPELLTWARERAGLDTLALAGRFPKLSEWEAGELRIADAEKFLERVEFTESTTTRSVS